jgi:GNAT superfamily N-acetyltransferase
MAGKHSQRRERSSPTKSRFRAGATRFQPLDSVLVEFALERPDVRESATLQLKAGTMPSQTITIAVASSSEQILATRDVMLQLRSSLPSQEYLPTVRRMMQADGYRLVALYEKGAVRAVAGFRYMEMLYCGKVLYVDDLNTDEAYRSRGFGKTLLDWLKTDARANGCTQLHLDSGVQRERTHHFYFREGLTIPAYHFRCAL